MHTKEFRERGLLTASKRASDFGFQMYFYRPPSPPPEKEQEETIIKKDKLLQLRFEMP